MLFRSHRTAQDLLHVGRADFGLYQADVSDFPRSLLPESLASSVARDPGVAAVAKVKLLVTGGTLVFGLASGEFAFRRLVVVAGARGAVMAGDHSGKRVGEEVRIAGRVFTVGGIAVTNTMAMSVFERTREIGILRALGWPVLRVGLMIVSETLAICLLALGVGCSLGVVAAKLFVGRSALSSLISPTYTASTFAWGLAFALGVGLIGALYPTWRAVRLAPVAALRHE